MNEQLDDDRYWDEDLSEVTDADRDSSLDDGRSDGCGESYAERNL